MAELRQLLDLEKARSEALRVQLGSTGPHHTDGGGGLATSQPPNTDPGVLEGSLADSGIADLRRQLVQVKHGEAKLEQPCSADRRQYLGVFEPELTHSSLATPKKAGRDAADYMRSDEGSDSKILRASLQGGVIEAADRFSRTRSEPATKDAQVSTDAGDALLGPSQSWLVPGALKTAETEPCLLQQRLSRLQADYDELVDEFCRTKVEKADTERELVGVLNCVENLADPRNVPCSVIRESAMSISDKHLARLRPYFREKNFLL